MKRFVSIVFALALAASLAGCWGGDKGTSSKPSSTKAPSSVSQGRFLRWFRQHRHEPERRLRRCLRLRQHVRQYGGQRRRSGSMAGSGSMSGSGSMTGSEAMSNS